MYVDVVGAEDIPMAKTLDTPIISREALADVASAAYPRHLTLPRQQVRPQHLTPRTRTRLRALMPQVEAHECDSLPDISTPRGFFHTTCLTLPVLSAPYTHTNCRLRRRRTLRPKWPFEARGACT